MTIHVCRLVIAGWTGRNETAVRAHIEELEKLGVPAPSRTPLFYRVAAGLLTTDPKIQVLGPHSSGEVEPVLCAIEGRMWVGVGSDHTDRQMETVGVAAAKQACAKPLGSDFWPLEEVIDHWDDLILRSFATRGGLRKLYQEGPAATIRRPEALMQLYTGSAASLDGGTVMFCGTLAVHGEICPAERWEIELEDPVRRRSICHAYDVETLEVVC